MNKTIYKIAFVGDIMQHEPQLKLEGKRNFIYKNIVSENIEKLLKSCDSVVGNFETIVDINKNPSGFPNFNVHENFVHELKRIGFTDLIVSNNHSDDQGYKSFDKSTKFIESLGIRTHGHKNYGVRTLKGCNKILLNASTAIMNNGYNTQSKVNWFYDSNFVPVKSLINIAYVHCGEEYNKEVTSEQQKIYKELNKYSEYKAIFMVHSHVIGSQNDMNIKDECYISNGLGNFISQQKMLDKQKGVITILEFDLIDKFIYSCESYETENILLNGAYITVSKQLDKLIENDDINLNF